MRISDCPPFRRFDHSDVHHLPEYRALAAAIDALAHRLEREDIAITQVEFERMLADVARHLPASDSCTECWQANADRDDDAAAESLRPHVPYANLDGDGGRYVYSCEHGHQWTCGWSQRAHIVAMGTS